MAIPHYTQLGQGFGSGPNGGAIDEVVYKNLFEITFVLPVILQAQQRNPLMLLQNALNIDFNLTEFDVKSVQQRFKYSTREFLTTPNQTSGDFTIKFNVNVNQVGSMENWNTMKAWYDLLFNSQNGTLHYKADMVGTVIVNQHDKKGVVLRRVTFQNVQLMKLQGYSLDWSSNDIVESVECTFKYDYFIDEYIDNNFTIAPPIISGY
ncbi:MAG: hypothetical protein M0R46_17990 [Candidatus Muirbacterium halophilum]|nr:hypothetical protein [Candidatus Muirbacterium halophilum]